MSDARNINLVRPRLVGCGWCPELLADDHVTWYAHFATVHNSNGYSIRHNVVTSDWDLSELVATDA